ncbi:MAG: preprotein translocase subunit YajC [Treponema sp.]|jgi:preprotein translocase subunit YajC|nr:preprotein translocase subunit YajC [Treponema sp.]
MATPGAEATGGNPLVSFVPFILIIAIFYFLIIRPQNKKQKETQKMLDSLKKGDKIVTIGGIHGTIQNVKDKSVIVKIDDNVKVEFSRSAISSVETPTKDKDEKDAKEVKKIEDNMAKSSAESAPSSPEAEATASAAKPDKKDGGVE